MEIQGNAIKYVKEEMPINFAILVAAKRGSGKTVLVRNLIYDLRDNYEEAYLFYGSYDTNPDDYPFFHPENVFSPDDLESLERIWKEQREYIQEGVHNGIKKEELKHIILVFDDFITSNMRREKAFEKIFAQGRHLNIAIIAVSQFVGGESGFKKGTRDNADAMFCFMPANEYDRDLIIGQWLSQSLEGKKGGHKLILEITCDENSPYRCMFITRTKNSMHYKDFVRHETAKLELPEFKIGKFPSDREGPFVNILNDRDRRNII
jgi:hypothetical protein